MDRDYYDDDLPDIYVSPLEYVKQNKDTLKTVGILIGIPAGLCLLSTFFTYYVSKKIETL